MTKQKSKNTPSTTTGISKKRRPFGDPVALSMSHERFIAISDAFGAPPKDLTMSLKDIVTSDVIE